MTEKTRVVHIYNRITCRHEWIAYDPDTVDVDADAVGYHLVSAEGVGETADEAIADLIQKQKDRRP